MHNHDSYSLTVFLSDTSGDIGFNTIPAINLTCRGLNQ